MVDLMVVSLGLTTVDCLGDKMVDWLELCWVEPTAEMMDY